MRRFWIGLVLLAALLAAGIWAGNRMERVHMPCAMDLQWAQSQASRGNWVAAGALTQRARDAWNRNWHFAAALANHQPMDEIDALFEELEVHLQRQDGALFCAACNYLAQKVRNLGDSFRLSWWNLL